MLGNILETAVTNHARMALLARIPTRQAWATLKGQAGRCVLLLLEQGKAPRSAATRFLARYPDLVVIRIELPGPSIAIDLRQLGLDQLLQTICSLGDEDLPGGGRQDRGPAYGGCHV